MVTRRNILEALASTAIASALPVLPTLAAHAAPKKKQTQTPSRAEAWMDRWMKGEKALGGAMRVSRFRDPMYFLIAPISWTPNLNETGKYQAVEAPNRLRDGLREHFHPYSIRCCVRMANTPMPR